jgi:hypothetical protein
MASRQRIIEWPEKTMSAGRRRTHESDVGRDSKHINSRS